MPLIILALKLISPFSEKISQGLKGRTEIWSRLKKVNFSTKKVVLIHCASLGEYEQIKPIINKLKNKNDEIRIILSFFSPSGYNRSMDTQIDLKIYLPLDLPYHMKRFFNSINIDVFVLAGYDVWPNAIRFANKFNVPTLIVSARLHEGSHRLKPVFSSMQREIYRRFDKVLTVSEGDSTRFKSLGVRESALEVLGNSRYDRVIERKGETVPNEDKISIILDEKPVIILGSIWRTDISITFDAILSRMEDDSNLSIIIAPHEPENKILELIESRLSEIHIGFVRSSDITSGAGSIRAIIINEIGYLAGLYKFAHIAYMGGGFGPGVHNVMEPAVYGIPVIHGPKLKSSETAKFLDESGGGFLVKTKEEFDTIFSKFLANDELRKASGLAAETVIIERAGATEKTVKVIQRYLK